MCLAPGPPGLGGIETRKKRRTYSREGGNVLIAVGAEILLRVVDGHSTIYWALEGVVLVNRYALVRPVASLKVQNCGPVVGKVLGELACRASGRISGKLHGRVEGIAANNLVDVGRRNLAGLDQRVEALNGHSRTAKSEGRLGPCHESEGEVEG